MKSRVLFGTYNGLLDPLGPSQILPYLERLHARWPVHILSFERPDRLADAAAVHAMEERIASRGLRWTRLRYHKWPSLLATSYDLACGVVAMRRIMWNEPIGLFHSRGYVPMAIATRATRTLPILFDVRGLQPEEYVDGGVWKKGELKWRLAKRDERAFFSRASGAVVLTRNIRPYVEEQLGRRVPLEVIPCCTELSRFAFDPEARRDRRRALGVPDDAFLFVYSGSIGTWYRPDHMARFVATFARVTGRPSHLLWLVNNDAARAREESDRAGLDARNVHVATAPPDQVASYLSAADAALALITPSFSKRSSSPTKYAECLAAGLPIVIHPGVGDGQDLVEHGCAVGLPSPPEPADFERGARELVELATRPRSFFTESARDLFDIDRVALPRYTSLYERLIA